MDSITAENKEVHIVGDFNIDLIKKSTSESKQILHLMEYQGFQQMVKTPTRITEHSSTLTDHHYRSHPEHVFKYNITSFWAQRSQPYYFGSQTKCKFEIYQESTLYCHIPPFKEIEC